MTGMKKRSEQIGKFGSQKKLIVRAALCLRIFRLYRPADPFQFFPAVLRKAVQDEPAFGFRFQERFISIRNIFTLSKAHIREIRDTIGKASISCRNFPLSPDELRQRLKIDDGGEYHIFATTTFENDKILILCNRLSV